MPTIYRLAPNLFVAIICLATCGCAPSALIRQSDRTFDLASQRFLASAKDLDKSALTPDGALFLQAEAFYDYRFSLESPNSHALAAEIAASATDFAPLGFWAASLEMGQFRIQAYDGAVQLYEALLEKYPSSPWKPMVLYRLGWAYRNLSMEGFPRDPEKSFAELSQGYPASPLAALAMEAMQVPYKTQGSATAWSILPGAGQMYIGHWGSGAIRLTLASAFAAIALVPTAKMIQDQRLDWAPALISLAGLVGLQVTYTTAYQDAKRQAIEFNEAKEAAFNLGHPDAP